MKFRQIISCFCCLLLVAGCNSKPEHKSEVAKQAEEHHEESNIVSLTDEQMKGAGIVIGSVEMKNLTTAIKVNGTLAVPNQNKALVTSLTNGVLQTLKVQPGNFVQKGEVIGTIANTEVSGIQQQLMSLNAQLKYAEQERLRQCELVAGNAAPLKNLQKVESEINSLEAQRKALQRQLRILGVPASGDIVTSIPIKAPISGNISEITAQIGSSITANAPIAQIINNSELHLDLFVYEKDLPKVAAGQTIHFTLTNNPGKEYDARIYSIGTAFVNETKAVPVHAHVINEKTGLIEGMSVTANISLGNKVYLAVPDEAIVNNGGYDYIFVLSDKKNEQQNNGAAGTAFQRVQVMRGASEIGYTQIEPVVSLSAGTKIAVKGAFFLMAKMTNSGDHD